MRANKILKSLNVDICRPQYSFKLFLHDGIIKTNHCAVIYILGPLIYFIPMFVRNNELSLKLLGIMVMTPFMPAYYGFRIIFFGGHEDEELHIIFKVDFH